MADTVDEGKKTYKNIEQMRGLLIKNKNIDILLYLAKYNPSVTVKDIVKHFGQKSKAGVDELVECDLVTDTKGKLTLTPEGIFQVNLLLEISS